ncbi:MAG TPA: lipid-binding SYLF domain-containing protein [Bryobacteraceae bacterium]|nr:lipid-binding SYLF domain-containing protein [Bryobacteraceae bacterium]
MKYVFVTFLLTPVLMFASTRSDTLNRVSDAASVFHEIMSAPDRGIPQDILNHAQCVGIIPGVKKAGFIVGAKYGKGVMVCRTRTGWSAPDTVIVEGGSFGFQIGAGETDVVLVVQNRSGERHVMQDKFTLGASAGVMAGPVGRTAQAETDAQLHAEILSYSRSRGLFAGVDLSGSTLRPDREDNRSLYGPGVSQRAILTGRVARPAAADRLYAELNRYAGAGPYPVDAH